MIKLILQSNLLLLINSMSASSLINVLQLSGIASTAVVGFKYGNKAKTFCLTRFPRVKNIYDNYFPSVYLKNSKVNEETMFNMIGCLTGVGIGYYAWPVAIPVGVVVLSNEYSDEIDKTKNYFKKK